MGRLIHSVRGDIGDTLWLTQHNDAAAGAMYWRLPNSVTAGVYDRVASLWFVGMVVVFMSGNSALTISYTQKPLLRREVYAGHYGYLPYYVAKTLTTLPLQLAYTALYVIMTYFLVRPSQALSKCPLRLGNLHFTKGTRPLGQTLLGPSYHTGPRMTGEGFSSS